MKLYEIFLNETATLVVYKVSSEEAIHVYYGYFVTEDEDRAKRQFLSAARAAGNSATHQDRGVARWLRDHLDNGGKINDRDRNHITGFDVTFEAYPNSPEEAFTTRNDMRVNDDRSITGPTYLPAEMWEQVKLNSPDQAEQWKANTRSRGKQAIADMSPEEFEAYTSKVKERNERAKATRSLNKANALAAKLKAADANKPDWLKSSASKAIRPVFNDEDKI